MAQAGDHQQDRARHRHASAATLGTLTATDGAPFARTTFTYSARHRGRRPAPAPKYDNTATIAETGSRPTPRPSGLRRQGPDGRQDGRPGPSTATYLWYIDKDVDKTHGQDRRGRHGDLQLHRRRRADRRHATAGWTLSRQDHRHQPQRLGGHHPHRPDRRRRQRRRPAPSTRGPYVVPAERLGRRRLHLHLRHGAQQLQRHQHRHGDLGQGDLLHPDRHGLREQGRSRSAQPARTNKTVHVTDTLRRRHLGTRDGDRRGAVRHGDVHLHAHASRASPARAPTTTTPPPSPRPSQPPTRRSRSASART